MDISTGEFRVTETDQEDAFLDELAGLNLREMLICEALRESDLAKECCARLPDCSVCWLPGDYFSASEARGRIAEFFSSNSGRVDFEGHPAITGATGAVLRYVQETQKGCLDHINEARWYDIRDYLVMDDTAKRNLELFATIQGGRKRGSSFISLTRRRPPWGGGDSGNG